MSRPQTGESGLLHLANRQLLLNEERRKLIDGVVAKQAAPYRFITISRDIGALGDVIGSELAGRLRWKVYDKEIVDRVAADTHVRQGIVNQLDEHAQNRIHDTISRVLRGGAFGNDEYHAAVIRTLVTLAAAERAILLGRGGAFALQGQPGLHVRVTAAPEVRVDRMSRWWNLPLAETRRRVIQVDAERRKFVRYHFNVDPDDMRFFHLVFNTDVVTVAQVVGAIAAIIEQPAATEADALRQPAVESLPFHSSDRETPLFA